jgi:ribosomal protein S18 acetylase RimI-like enzyme
VSHPAGAIRRYRDEDRSTVWALSQIPHIGATADPSVPLDLSRDDPGNWDDLWDIHSSHIARGGDFLVYEFDGRVVAMGAVMTDGRGTGEINYVRVHPALRRRGIGRAVMDALERGEPSNWVARTHTSTRRSSNQRRLRSIALSDTRSPVERSFPSGS